MLMAVIFACFAIQISMAHPMVSEVLAGFIPRLEVVTDPVAFYLAVGILGATVMPHNLYLHSSIVQTRAYPRTPAGKRMGLHWAVTDSTVALMMALFVNAAILITSAAAFHKTGIAPVEDIGQAYHLLSPMLGIGLASTLFAVALLASGINSTVTATLAGQIVMEGFIHLKMAGWLRRVLTRGMAIIPVIVVTYISGGEGMTKLLIFSQVILSMQLPFAVVPLVRFVSNRQIMNEFTLGLPTKVMAWFVTGVIIGLNLYLVIRFIES